MPEDNGGAGATDTGTAATSTDGAGAAGQNGENGAGAAAGTGAGTGPATLEEAQALLAAQQNELARANREAAERRVKLKEYEDAEAERVKQGMSEIEQRDARIKELETENGDLKSTLSESSFTSAAVDAAKSLGFRNPLLAPSLIDKATRTALTPDGKLDEAKLTETLKDRLKSDPYLGTGGGADGGNGRGGQPQGASMNDVIRGAARK